MNPHGRFSGRTLGSRTEFGSAFLNPEADYRIQLVKTDRNLTHFLSQERVILFKITETRDVTSSASSRIHNESLPTKGKKERIFARVKEAVYELHARGGKKPSLFAMTLTNPSPSRPVKWYQPGGESATC